MDLNLQKAGVMKRFSAWMCDVVAFFMVALCIALILSSILGYDKYNDTLVKGYEKYGQEYGVDLNISREELASLSDEEKAIYDKAGAALNRDAEVVKAYAMVQTLPMLMISISIFVSSMILDFVIPLIFKNGQTLGKKLFGIAVIRTNCVKLTGPALFIRSILGKCTMETMVPTYIIIMILSGSLGLVGFGVLILIALLQIIMIIVTQTNSAIHDLLADTVVVDLASQRIFDSNEALIEYKQKVHEEMAKNARY